MVIDVLDAQGMLSSRKWANLGGSIQMDLSCATIATCENTYVKLCRGPMMKYHVENLKELRNELVSAKDDFKNYVIMARSTDPLLQDTLEEGNGAIWKIHFDRAQSKIGVGEGITFTSPQGEITSFFYRLEFDCTNNIATKYEAMLLGLEFAREMGIEGVESHSKF
jgi:hypothetical protein